MSYRIAMFGTGLMARIYADAILQRSDAVLVAVVGNTPEKTAEFACRYRVPGYPHSRYTELLENHTADAIIITTPEWVRLDPLEIAVKTKKSILLEKPLSDSWKTTKKCADLLKEYPAYFQVCHVLRYSPRFNALYKAVKEGEIGDIRHIHARRNSNQTRARRVLGRTDLAFWLAPHDIDLMRWVTGAQVAEVFARSRHGLKELDDYLMVTLRFTSGVDALLEISWCAPPVGGGSREALFEVFGNWGNIELDDAAMNVKIFTPDSVRTPDTYEDFWVQSVKGGYFRYLVDDFLNHLGDPVANPVSLEDAVENCRVCAMIRKSIDEGRAVRREEFV